jgi:hypothetical protein
VKDFPTPDGQFLYAQGNPSDEAAWYAVKAKIDADSGNTNRREYYDRMQGRCDVYLAMIYLNDTRRSQAERIFSEFVGSTDAWRRAHGAAGLAILEDMKGANANRGEIQRRGMEAMNSISQAPEGYRRLEPIVGTALQEAMRRRP